MVRQWTIQAVAGFLKADFAKNIEYLVFRSRVNSAQVFMAPSYRNDYVNNISCSLFISFKQGTKQPSFLGLLSSALVFLGQKKASLWLL